MLALAVTMALAAITTTANAQFWGLDGIGCGVPATCGYSWGCPGVAGYSFGTAYEVCSTFSTVGGYGCGLGYPFGWGFGYPLGFCGVTPAACGWGYPASGCITDATSCGWGWPGSGYSTPAIGGWGYPNGISGGLLSNPLNGACNLKMSNPFDAF